MSQHDIKFHPKYNAITLNCSRSHRYKMIFLLLLQFYSIASGFGHHTTSSFFMIIKTTTTTPALIIAQKNTFQVPNRFGHLVPKQKERKKKTAFSTHSTSIINRTKKWFNRKCNTLHIRNAFRIRKMENKNLESWM